MNTDDLNQAEAELDDIERKTAVLQQKLVRLESGESYLDLLVGRTLRREAANDPFAAQILRRFSDRT